MAEPSLWTKFGQFKDALLRKQPDEGEERVGRHRNKGEIPIIHTQGKWVGKDDKREYIYHPGTNTIDEIGEGE